MAETKMISVLMAVKTGWKYMPHSVGSLLGQSYTDWELIVGVNGLGEQNGAFNLASSIVKAMPANMTAINQPGKTNKAAALNEMVGRAKGEFIAILDVDDLWHPLKLEKQVGYLDTSDVVGTKGEYFGDHAGDIRVPGGVVSFASLRSSNCILNSSAIVRKELAAWEEMNQPIEDYELWLRLASRGRRLFNVPETLTFIRQHDEQWSRKESHDVDALRKRYA